MTASTILLEQANLDRVRYFSRQLITVEDMLAEQAYFREKLRRHNRFLHGWGVVCGCEVVAAPEKNHSWRVQICPGYVVTPLGDEIFIPPTSKTFFDFTSGTSQDSDPCEQAVPCPPSNRVKTESESKTVYLAVCSTECHVRPLRIHPAGCGCDDAACEYSRIREGFEFIQLWDLPESHKLAEKEDEALCKKFQEAAEFGTSATTHNYGNGSKVKKFVPDCPESVEDDCVVLAQVTLSGKQNDGQGELKICYEGRRVLYSTRTLQALCSCIPPTTPEVRISIQPEAAELPKSGTQQFTATVAGSDNKAVTWKVEQSQGGTISATGLYTAPQAEGTFNVMATSVANTSKFARATVTVKAEMISVSIEPKSANLIVGETQQLTATVTGDINNEGVTWKVEEGEAMGTIEVSDDGTSVYWTPYAAGTYHVVATSKANTKISDTAIVTVEAPSISVSIEPTTFEFALLPDPVPASKQFTATVMGDSENKGVIWTVEAKDPESEEAGTISGTGEYTPPKKVDTYYVVATSAADSSAFAKATVEVFTID
jgi:hypothetical protein